MSIQSFFNLKRVDPPSLLDLPLETIDQINSNLRLTHLAVFARSSHICCSLAYNAPLWRKLCIKSQLALSQEGSARELFFSAIRSKSVAAWMAYGKFWTNKKYLTFDLISAVNCYKHILQFPHASEQEKIAAILQRCVLAFHFESYEPHELIHHFYLVRIKEISAPEDKAHAVYFSARMGFEHPYLLPDAEIYNAWSEASQSPQLPPLYRLRANLNRGIMRMENRAPLLGDKEALEIFRRGENSGIYNISIHSKLHRIVLAVQRNLEPISNEDEKFLLKSTQDESKILSGFSKLILAILKARLATDIISNEQAANFLVEILPINSHFFAQGSLYLAELCLKKRTEFITEDEAINTIERYKEDHNFTDYQQYEIRRSRAHLRLMHKIDTLPLIQAKRILQY